jgi:hypothetical protein
MGGNNAVRESVPNTGSNWASSTPIFSSPDYKKEQQFGLAHPDADPPAKGQTYDSFVKAYGDAHPQKTEHTQGVPAAPPPQVAPVNPEPAPTPLPATFSTPQSMQNVKAIGTTPQPMASAMAQTKSPTQATQMSQGMQAAKAANQMAGVSDAKQFSLPNVGQITFGGS